MSRPPAKTKIVSARMTPASLAQALSTAAREGKSVSEWAAGILMNALTSPEPDINAQLLFSELAAIRAGMLMLMQHAVNGTKVTEQDLIAIVDDSDQARFKIAAKRLREGMKVLAPLGRKGVSE